MLLELLNVSNVFYVKIINKETVFGHKIEKKHFKKLSITTKLSGLSKTNVSHIHKFYDINETKN